ncbi:MAG: hypothetical protein WD232_06680 [Acidimicrobiales bacterium]
MSPPAGRRRRRPNRSKVEQQAPPSDFWRAPPTPSPPDKVAPVQDPTALLRSLGTPPLPVHSSVADASLALVTVHASRLAIALAAAADLLDDGDPD